MVLLSLFFFLTLCLLLSSLCPRCDMPACVYTIQVRDDGNRSGQLGGPADVPSLASAQNRRHYPRLDIWLASIIARRWQLLFDF